VRVDDLVQGHRQHGGIGESVAKHKGGEQILRALQQLRHDPASAGIPLTELRHLPLAEGKQGGFRQRKEETRAGKHQYGQHRLLHPPILPQMPRLKKRNATAVRFNRLKYTARILG
jgi:hypothetical protein